MNSNTVSNRYIRDFLEKPVIMKYEEIFSFGVRDSSRVGYKRATEVGIIAELGESSGEFWYIFIGITGSIFYIRRKDIVSLSPVNDEINEAEEFMLYYLNEIYQELKNKSEENDEIFFINAATSFRGETVALRTDMAAAYYDRTGHMHSDLVSEYLTKNLTPKLIENTSLKESDIVYYSYASSITMLIKIQELSDEEKIDDDIFSELISSYENGEKEWELAPYQDIVKGLQENEFFKYRDGDGKLVDILMELKFGLETTLADNLILTEKDLDRYIEEVVAIFKK